MILSKSQYIRGLQCPKSLWLYKKRPQLRVVSKKSESMFESGISVGDLAKKLFEGGVLIEFDENNFEGMIKKTKELIANETQVIYEATFKEKNIFAMADILVKNGDCWDMYEVKSSTSPKEYHIDDAAIQWYALSNALKLNKAYIIHINNEYEREGSLDVKKLFKAVDVTELVLQKQKEIPLKLKEIEEVLKGDEPDINIGRHCFSPFECDFYEYCWQDIPKVSVFDLYRMNFDKKLDLYKKGIVELKDVDENILNQTQKIQVKTVKENKIYIDKNVIKSFLEKLKFPLNFLDFETFAEAVPRFDRLRPYQQIPFQYSLHILYEDKRLIHKEFLADEFSDPREEFKENLLNDLTKEGSIIAFNKPFEIGRIKELSDFSQKYKNELLGLIERFEDLIEPFRNLGYYHPDFNGSFSIKSILPAMFAKEPELDYKNLGSVQNGSDAMNTFANLHLLKDRSKRDEIRKDLLRYCRLDTLAMVKIYQKLLEVVI
jgi:hypothetical protein